METSSYLFLSKNRKRFHYSSRKMEKDSSSDSNLSIDSLEADFKHKTFLNSESTHENANTILVPFYEKDVLIQIPKGQIRKQKHENNIKLKKESQHTNSYLVNKDRDKSKRRSSYLDMFRKQFTKNTYPQYQQVEKKRGDQEIRSVSPEVGDTERESFGEENNSPVSEFYNTECYNEIYYDKLLRQEYDQYSDNSLEEEMQLTENVKLKSRGEIFDENLKSISEVSQPRRHVRRATAEPLQNVKLGGLGPDIEKIRPRLERARSLQRYSEKIRMENRLRIYKKALQTDHEKTTERDSSAKRQESAKRETSSYLVNKEEQEKSSKVAKNMYCSKSKSAGQEYKHRNREPQLKSKPIPKNQSRNDEKVKSAYQDSQSKRSQETSQDKIRVTHESDPKLRIKSGIKSKAISTGTNAVSTEIPPVHISFRVNVGGVRPSSALKRLEEKHQMYQEQVKAFSVEKNE